MRFGHSNDLTDQANIDMTPLVDIVFILLIFFILSASFQKQNQIKIDRPQSQISDSVTSLVLMVSIDKQNIIWMDKEQIKASSLTSKIKQKAKNSNNLSVVIHVDKQVSSGNLIEVIDKIRIAGVNNVAVATQIN
ncbi:TonB system transport protein ExbD2 [Psychromonas sp. CNPT3]|uniref:ExbD/TolR family protein n=1 Tax=Psychromonas sp. CNPT3 TaxID=314282 RepID=UPI00006E9E4D|nr:biopolymer transporter ExbD [Psychromonas sp. CNPT3]AGH82350.1 TonB system transport protein ExbD2 [Psychromonas sp. CNPT3]